MHMLLDCCKANRRPGMHGLAHASLALLVCTTPHLSCYLVCKLLLEDRLKLGGRPGGHPIPATSREQRSVMTCPRCESKQSAGADRCGQPLPPARRASASPASGTHHCLGAPQWL